MRNPPNPKERNLVKGAIMRVFSRSELRREVIDESIMIGYIDTSRPRVKTWCKCKECETPTPKSYMAVDHIEPKVPVDSSLEEMSWDELVDNTWCAKSNLQPICTDCHDRKSKAENKVRRKLKKEKKNDKVVK
jgi:5-methylcytosine-specific restriction endonuclease McrA